MEIFCIFMSGFFAAICLGCCLDEEQTKLEVLIFGILSIFCMFLESFLGS